MVWPDVEPGAVSAGECKTGKARAKRAGYHTSLSGKGTVDELVMQALKRKENGQEAMMNAVKLLVERDGEK